ncbi:hypothetical protein JTB14_000783 [Gonioctena quinquepunctata]|nr:hypothetical protein JTB14_000783 [Gonioctena quinquepunctata]
MQVSSSGDEEDDQQVTHGTYVWGPVTGSYLKKFDFLETENGTGFKAELYETMYNKTPYDFYKLFVNDDIINLMVTETNRYADQCIEKTVYLEINEVNNGWSLRAAAIQANVVLMTLKRYIDKYKAVSEEDRVHICLRRTMKSIRFLEDLLRDYLITAFKMHHGLMKFAYELAGQNNLKFPNSWHQHKHAGVDWLKT